MYGLCLEAGGAWTNSVENCKGNKMRIDNSYVMFSYNWDLNVEFSIQKIRILKIRGGALIMAHLYVIENSIYSRSRPGSVASCIHKNYER